MASFVLRHNGSTVAAGGLKWSDALRGFDNATPGQNGRRNVVRYDSPTFEGFTFIAAAGENSVWDAAITYKNKIGDFSLLAAQVMAQATIRVMAIVMAH